MEDQKAPSIDPEVAATHAYAEDVIIYYAEKLAAFQDKLNPPELVILIGYILGQVTAQDRSGLLFAATMEWTRRFVAMTKTLWEEVNPDKPFPDVSTSPIFFMVPEPAPEGTPRPDVDFYLKRTSTTIQ